MKIIEVFGEFEISNLPPYTAVEFKKFCPDFKSRTSNDTKLTIKDEKHHLNSI